ncbi:hypothetical protein, variant 2 [Fonticula alba]|uniref:Uncharacterized protein n=1 Tax=Fonticula alba TaxID=691883 RepID=A0A058Z8M3_FONAL|nr:hypothetical protein, variant 1 [Fonticula alba]XP_009495484.1 hypothetical protein, variant 2 [Fonticula alba]KCV69877.1 hypothetical protein, variant 1 [Fonticula alba]KCV69878.1 hypothetical protein, variant 2 [Fonticula alba]|eukprot:XP_009495483.1 hypothetical protein, variant 1 [Fonticula alba]
MCSFLVAGSCACVSRAVGGSHAAHSFTRALSVPPFPPTVSAPSPSSPIVLEIHEREPPSLWGPGILEYVCACDASFPPPHTVRAALLHVRARAHAPTSEAVAGHFPWLLAPTSSRRRPPPGPAILLGEELALSLIHPRGGDACASLLHGPCSVVSLPTHTVYVRGCPPSLRLPCPSLMKFTLGCMNLMIRTVLYFAIRTEKTRVFSPASSPSSLPIPNSSLSPPSHRRLPSPPSPLLPPIVL